MALTDGTLNSLGGNLKSLLAWASLHSADPGTTGTNEIAAAGRKDLTDAGSVDWSVDADGDLTLTGTLAFTGMTGSQAVTHIGFWSASSAGTFRGSFALTGDSTANAAGEYNVTGVTITGTSS